MTRNLSRYYVGIVCIMLAIAPLRAQPAAPVLPPAPSFADLVDLAEPAPLALDATIRSAIRLKPEASPGLRPGHTRFYIVADLNTLIRGEAGQPARFSYLYDAANDARGRPAKLAKKRILLLAKPVPGRPGEVQLVAPDAQLDWTAAVDARLRDVLRQLVSGDAPPRITAVGRGFHTAGALAGESESQIFLSTTTGDPVSLSIIRRPGQTPLWSVALGEIVDEAATAPQPETLLWYRLACFLPRALPPASTADAGREDAAALTRDYRLVIEGLGDCPRTRARRVTDR